MFEKQLESQLKEIFGVKKVTFAEPGESKEQECLFIEIEKSPNHISDRKFIARPSGTLTIFGNSDKMPYGFFSKKIADARPEAKKGLAFFDFERNTNVFQNIVQRTVAFTYFFSGQFDPNIGIINEVNIQIEVNP